MRREMIRIDEEKCTGCGECVPNCPEGALQIIDGKARLVSDLFCDGLGACIGHCPEGAITVEEREAEPYDERRVMENVVRHGANTIRAHLEHLRGHGQNEFLAEAVAFLREKGVEVPAGFIEAPAKAARPHGDGGTGEACGASVEDGTGGAGNAPNPSPRGGEPRFHGGCPGARIVDRRGEADDAGPAAAGPGAGRPCGAAIPPAAGGEPARPSALRQWPVQINLVPPNAPFLRGTDLLVAADCVPFAHASFHEELLAGRVLLVGCPKFDDTARYREKLAAIFRDAGVRSVTVAHMEVPCCNGIVSLVKDAIAASGRIVPMADVTIGIDGTVRIL